jgi:hypothetical protein
LNAFQQIVIAVQSSIGVWLVPFDLLIYQIVTDSKCAFTVDNASVSYPSAVKSYNPSEYAFVAPAAGIYGCQIQLRAGMTLYYGGVPDLNFHLCNISYVQDESVA